MKRKYEEENGIADTSKAKKSKKSNISMTGGHNKPLQQVQQAVTVRPVSATVTTLVASSSNNVQSFAIGKAIFTRPKLCGPRLGVGSQVIVVGVVVIIQTSESL